MFDYNSDERLIDGFNLDKIENYAKAPERLGLTDFAADTITSKLGMSRLSDIPTNQTLTDLINHVCPTTLTHDDYNDRYTESEQFRRINSKLNNKKKAQTLKSKIKNKEREIKSLQVKLANQQRDFDKLYSNTEKLNDEKERLEAD